MRNKFGLMRGEKGQILIWVVALMMLAALVIPPFIASAYSGLHTSAVRQEKMQELYAADSGIEDALMWIQSEWNNVTITKPGNPPPTFPPGNSSTASPATYTLSDAAGNPKLINNCQVDVKLERDVENYPYGNYTYFVYATATNKDKGGQVKVRVHASPAGPFTTWSLKTLDPVSKPQGNVSNNPFSYAMGSLGYGSEVNLKQDDITGDVFVRGSVNLVGGQNVVRGNIYSVGDLTLYQQSYVTGNASVTGNLLLEEGSYIEGNAWGNQSITIDSANGIWGDAYAQTDVNVNTGSLGGSAWADHNVNVSSVINQSAFANNDINVPGGEIEGEAYYWISWNISGGGSVGNPSGIPSPLNNKVQVPQPIMPQIGDASGPAEAAAQTYSGNATSTENPITPTTKVQGVPTLIISGSGNSLGPVYINGSLLVKNNAELTLTGTVYVKGSITLGNGAVVTTGNSSPIPNSTPKVLVAEGSISIASNIVAQPDQAMPLIMSVYGSIECWNNSVINAALYAPNGTVWVHNGAYVYGAIVAQQITPIKDTGQTKQTTVVYNPAVQNIPGLPYATIEGPGDPEWEYPTEMVPTTHPVGVYVDSYIVLE